MTDTIMLSMPATTAHVREVKRLMREFKANMRDDFDCAADFRDMRGADFENIKDNMARYMARGRVITYADLSNMMQEYDTEFRDCIYTYMVEDECMSAELRNILYGD